MRHTKKSSIASVFVMLFVILIIYLSYLALREKTSSPIYGLKEKELSARAEVELSIVRAELAFALKNSILNAMYRVGNSCCSEKEYTVVAENVQLDQNINQKLIGNATADLQKFLQNYPKEKGLFSIKIPELEVVGLNIEEQKINDGLYDNSFDAYIKFKEPINLTYNKLIISSPREVTTKINSKFFYVLRSIYSFLEKKDYQTLRRTLSSSAPDQHISEGCQTHNFDNIGATIKKEFSQKLNTIIGEGISCEDFYIINGTSKPRDKINMVVAQECENPEELPVAPSPICKNLHKQYNADSWNSEIVQKFAQATTARQCLQYDYELYLEIITLCKLIESEHYTDLGVEPLTFRFRTLFPIDVQCVAELSCP